MREITALLLSLVLVGAALVGCKPTKTVSEPILRTQEQLQVVSEAKGKGPDEIMDAGEQAAFDRARTTLAVSKGGKPEDYALVSIQKVEWSDGSLGCPQPGVSYMQVITPGYRVALKAGDTVSNVHVGNNRAVICAGLQTQQVQRRGYAVSALAVDAMRTKAKEDLAAQLGVPPDQIKAGLLVPSSWPDTSMGCPEPDVEYPKRETRGFRLMLSYRGSGYTYHTDGQRVFPCPPIRNE